MKEAVLEKEIEKRGVRFRQNGSGVQDLASGSVAWVWRHGQGQHRRCGSKATTTGWVGHMKGRGRREGEGMAALGQAGRKEKNGLFQIGRRKQERKEEREREKREGEKTLV